MAMDIINSVMLMINIVIPIMNMMPIMAVIWNMVLPISDMAAVGTKIFITLALVFIFLIIWAAATA